MPYKQTKICQMDDKHYKKIYNFKGPFKCRKGITRGGLACKSTECYKLDNFSRKCKKCGAVESITANTAFEGIRKVSITDMLKAFKKMQAQYIKYIDYEIGVQDRDGDEQMPTEMQIRLPCEKIGAMLNITRESAWRLIKRIIAFLPDEYYEFQEAEISDLWTKGTRAETDEVYMGLLNLLFRFRFSLRKYVKRSQSEILGILSSKEYAVELSDKWW